MPGTQGVPIGEHRRHSLPGVSVEEEGSRDRHYGDGGRSTGGTRRGGRIDAFV